MRSNKNFYKSLSKPLQAYMAFGDPTSVSVLDRSLRKMLLKFTPYAYAGPKVSAYPDSNAQWRGHVWDLCLVRSIQTIFHCANILLLPGVLPLCVSAGRPSGVGGEVEGQGCKAYGHRAENISYVKKGKVKIKVWRQVQLQASSCFLLDKISEWLSTRKKTLYAKKRLSRQQVLTLLSRLALGSEQDWKEKKVVSIGPEKISIEKSLKESSMPSWVKEQKERKVALLELSIEESLKNLAEM